MSSIVLPRVVRRLRLVASAVLVIAALLAAWTGSLALGAQGTQVITLLGDTDPRIDTTRSSQPSRFYTIGTTTYFAATDSIHGRQLWKTNGQATGTALVKDNAPINPNDDDCKPTALHNILYYCSERKVWRSDGTPQGTWLLQQINPDDANTVSSLTATDNRIYFMTQSNDHTSNGAPVLWTSDGTPEGTVEIKKLREGAELEAVGSVLYFSADGFLWKTDGTRAGTVPIITGYTSTLVRLGNKLLFLLHQADGNGGLYRTDGTVEGTVRISTNSELWYSRAVVGDTLFFSDDGLWKTDGTAEGTMPVTSLPLSQPHDLTAVGNRLFFVVSGQTGRELWKSDGTSAGTGRVKDLRPDSEGTHIDGLTAVGDVLYFVTIARQGSGFVRNLWRTDGNESGTSIVWKSEIDQRLHPLHNANGTLLFGCMTRDAGQELCRSDGTVAGTGLLRDINVDYGETDYEQLMSVGERVYFTTSKYSNSELWTSDGTPAGTQQVKDIVPGTEGSLPEQFTNAAGKLFFSAKTPAQGRELWTSDGTSAGTQLVKDITSGAASTKLLHLTTLGSNLFFFTTEGATAPTVRMWTSDGSENGTTVIKEWKSKTAYPVSFATAIGSQLYFAVDDGEHGVELWTSDGTNAGTRLIIDLTTGPESSQVSRPVALGESIYFLDNMSENPYTCPCTTRLYRSDGTAAGTSLVTEFTNGSMRLLPHSFTATKQALFFVFDEDNIKRDLWTSDGTAAGTRFVVANATFTQEALDTVLVFTRFDEQYHRELWSSDGTPSGTTRISGFKPVQLGLVSSSIRRFPGTNTVGFAADNGSSGTELWLSDGTTEGTRMVADIDPGPGSSTPWTWVKAGNQFVTIAASSTTGRALWAITELNSKPTVMPQTIQVQSNGTVSGTLSAQDDDGDPLEFTITVQPRNGTAVITDPARGTFTYTAFAGTSGSDEWSYRVSDGQNETHGTVSVQITQMTQSSWRLFIPLTQR